GVRRELVHLPRHRYGHRHDPRAPEEVVQALPAGGPAGETPLRRPRAGARDPPPLLRRHGRGGPGAEPAGVRSPAPAPGGGRRGIGSTFTIRLQALVAEGKGEVKEIRAEKTEPRPASGFSLPRPSGDAVLVIEDNETAREALRKFLTQKGFAARAASGGEE